MYFDPPSYASKSIYDKPQIIDDSSTDIDDTYDRIVDIESDINSSLRSETLASGSNTIQNRTLQKNEELPEIPSYRWRPGQISFKSFNLNLSSVKAPLSQSHCSKSSTPAEVDFKGSSHTSEEFDDFSSLKESPIRSMKSKSPYWRTNDRNNQPQIEPSHQTKHNSRNLKVRNRRSLRNHFSKWKNKFAPNSDTLLPPCITCRFYILFLLLITVVAIGSALVYQFAKTGTLFVSSTTAVSSSDTNEDPKLEIPSNLDFKNTPNDPNLNENLHETQASQDLRSDSHSLDDTEYPYQWKLTDPTLTGPIQNAWFGYATSISADGNILAIGTPMAPNQSIGMVQVFQYNFIDQVWKPMGNRIFGQIPGDRFGQSVSLSPDGFWLAVSAKWYNNFNTKGQLQNDKGNVQIFHYIIQKKIWKQKGSDIMGLTDGDKNGHSISISNMGERVAVGAPGNSEAGTNAGLVQIYECEDFIHNQNGSYGWNQIGSNIFGPKEESHFGHTVSLSFDGMRVAIGSSTNLKFNTPISIETKTNNRMKSNGGVSVYQQISNQNINEPSSQWEQMGQLIEGDPINDEAGYAVSLSFDGTRVAIGAVKKDRKNLPNLRIKTLVRVYQYHVETSDIQNKTNTKGIWSQLGSDIEGKEHGEHFGTGVQLSPDGNRVVIGGSQIPMETGYIRIFEYSKYVFSWIQIAKDINGVTNGDFAGYSVSLSADGNRVVIGSPMNDDNGKDSGHVRIFDLQAQ